MPRVPRVGPAVLATIAALVFAAAGCTSPMEYVRNGFKVGPNYQPAPAPVAAHWIDASDAQVRSASPDLARWWNVFNDPTLNRLVGCAFQQNLSLRQAGFRVLEARLELAIARGELFPQTQTANGGYNRIAPSFFGISNVPSEFLDHCSFGFTLAWELDFWGRLRRAITAGQDNLDASVANYDQAVVTMLGDIAQNYVQVRTDQERIRLLRESVDVQQGVLNFIEARFKVGFKVNELDLEQAKSNLGRPRPRSCLWRSTCARPRTASAPCWGSRRRTCNICWAQRLFPWPRRKWPSAFPPNCSAAAPTCGRPSGWRPPRPSRSASPRPSCIRPSPLPALWSGRRRASRTSSPPAR